MAKIKWYEVIKRAFRAYTEKDKYVYFYGAKGQKLTDAEMNYLWNAEPGHFKKYTAQEKVEIFNNSRGKIGYDCSGFTGWVCTGDKQYSKGQVANGKKNASIAEGVAGSLLFTTFGGTGRHIGLDIGLGYCMHMGNESTNKNIAEGKAGIRFEKLSDNKCAWEGSYESNVVDYTGSSNA